MGSYWSDRASAGFVEALPPANGEVVPDPDFPELESMARALHEVRSYGQADHRAAIVAAMQAPSDDDKLAEALEALAPSVRQIMGWHALAEGLADSLPRLLARFDEAAIKHSAGEHLRSVRALATMLAFFVDFDAAKLSTPSIQNDFSFVKRASTKAPQLTQHLVEPAAANTISMFIAQSSPMIARMALAVDAAKQTRSLAAVAGLCCAALGDKRLPADKVPGCLGAMTTAFVLYDRALKSPGGAFASASLVSARKVANAVRKHANDQRRLDILFGAYRYTSLNYASTASSAVRNIVER